MTCSGWRTARRRRTRRRCAWSGQHTTTPLAIGEIFNTVYDYQTIIKEQLIDYVRAASTHFGGISPLKKVMDFAAQYQIKSGFHGPTDISPVGFAAQLHVGLAIHNYGIQEYMQHSDATNRCSSSP